MLRLQAKRRLLNAGHDRDRLAAIARSSLQLAEGDLLDLTNIVTRGGPTPLQDIASTQMRSRNIKL